MRRTLLAVALVLLALRPALADSKKPIVVMSFAGYDAMMEDVKFGGDLIGRGVENRSQLHKDPVVSRRWLWSRIRHWRAGVKTIFEEVVA